MRPTLTYLCTDFTVYRVQRNKPFWYRTWQAEWTPCPRAPRAYTERGVRRKADRWMSQPYLHNKMRSYRMEQRRAWPVIRTISKMMRGQMRIKTTEKSLLYKALTVVIYRTKNADKAKKSKYQYGKNDRGYFLRPMGIVYYYFGITLELSEITKKLEDV